MARVDRVQTNFTRGVISPRSRGRFDVDGFFNAAEALGNVWVLPQGGVSRRAGTRFVAEVQDNSKESQLYAFQFSVTQTYMLEFADSAISFFADEGQVFAANVTASITNGGFDSDVSSWTDNSNGTGSIAHDTGGDGGRMQLNAAGAGNEAIATQSISITETNTEHHLKFRIQRSGGQGTDRSETVTVRIGDTSGGASNNVFADKAVREGDYVISFDPGGNSTVHLSFEYGGTRDMFVDDVSIIDNTAITVQTPYDESDVQDIRPDQSADVLYVPVQGHQPRELRRTSGDTFDLPLHDFEDGPYLPQNITDTTLTVDSASGYVTLTASSTEGINDGDGFKTTDVGRLVRIKNASSGDWSWGEIVAHTDSTNVTFSVRGPDMDSTATPTEWRLGSWSDTTGWPEMVAFHDGRLLWARNSDQPQTLWGSQPEDFPNQAPSRLSDGATSSSNAINVTLAVSGQVNAVQWLVSQEAGLLVGTRGAEVLVRQASTADPLGPANIQAVPTAQHGSADVQAIPVRTSVVFVQRDTIALREMAPATDTISASYTTAQVSFLAEHLFRDGVEQLAFMQSPVPLLWGLTEAGEIRTLTIDQERDTFAWTTQPIGDAAAGDGVVESIAVMPEGKQDQIWLIVRRTVNGNTVRHIEFIEDLFNGDTDDIEDAFFVDSGLSLDNPVGGGITNATQADPVVVTTDSAHGLSDGNQIRIRDVVGMTELNDRSFLIANSTSTTFELQDLKSNNIDGSGFTAYDSGGTVREEVDTLSGLDHLEGETVAILANGSAHPTKTVSSGSVTLDRKASIIHIGLAQEDGVVIELLPFESGVTGTSTFGRVKRTHLVHVRLGGTVGLNMSDGEQLEVDVVPFRDSSMAMNEPVPPFTGTKTQSITSRHGRETSVRLTNTQPLPVHVLNVGVETQVHGS